MSNEPVSKSATVGFSLAAAVACVLANSALASPSAAPPASDQTALSVRAAAIVERIRLADPALVNKLPPEQKIAQWRNK